MPCAQKRGEKRERETDRDGVTERRRETKSEADRQRELLGVWGDISTETSRL